MICHGIGTLKEDIINNIESESVKSVGHTGKQHSCRMFLLSVNSFYILHVEKPRGCLRICFNSLLATDPEVPVYQSYYVTFIIHSQQHKL